MTTNDNNARRAARFAAQIALCGHTGLERLRKPARVRDFSGVRKAGLIAVAQGAFGDTMADRVAALTEWNRRHGKPAATAADVAALPTR